MTDEGTPIEVALKAEIDQLTELEKQIGAVTDNQCFDKIKISSRKISSAYDPFTKALSDCTKNASSTYNAQIREFTRVHFVALPLINKINGDLSSCNSGNVTGCITDKFLTRYCNDATTCTACATM